jgi:hypothetical protein
MNKNPDKWIRKEISTRINNMVVSTKTIPCIDTNYTGATQPMNYVAMSTQTKLVGELNKCNQEWDCTILLDITTRYLSPGNTGSRLLADDIEERIIFLMNNFTVQGGFDVYRAIILESSNDTDGHTDTEVYFRQLMRYRIRLIEQ